MIIFIVFNILIEKVEVVNRLKKDLAYETIKNYTIDYDKTWIFDKIQLDIKSYSKDLFFEAMKSISFVLSTRCKRFISQNLI